MGKTKGLKTHSFRYVITGYKKHSYHPMGLYHILTKNAPIKIQINHFRIRVNKLNRRFSVESCRFLKCFDNNDTGSYGFKRFHSKNKTIKQEVKLSYGTETMLISLSN